MKRGVFVALIFACSALPLAAQTLTEADVEAKMNEAFALMKENKDAEALDAFLIVGRNTELRRNEPERQIYVVSQTMACSRYRKLQRYEEGYRLAKKLLSLALTDKEKKDVGYEYAYCGYMYASSFMTKGERQYAYARALLQEVAPYAVGNLEQYVLPKIPYSYFLEASQNYFSQRFAEAVRLFDTAREGYHKLGKSKDELSAWKWMAASKEALDDVEGAGQAYRGALGLARAIGQNDVQMELLRGLRKQAQSKGDDRLAHIYEASMDSLVEHMDDVKVRCDYFHQKGLDAQGQSQYQLAEQWLLRENTLVENSEMKGLETFRHANYIAQYKLYEAVGRYTDALAYAQKSLAVYQAMTPSTDAMYNQPYIGLAHIYRKMGQRTQCYACLEKAFDGADRMTEPREKSSLYTARGICRMSFADFNAALSDFREADAMLASKYSQADGGRVRLAALMGGAEHQLGQYALSVQSYERYVEGVKALYGEQSIEYVDAQIVLANAEGFAGHIEEGCTRYAAAARQLRGVMRQRLPYMSQTEREGFWQPLSELFTKMTPYALQAGRCQTIFTRDCYDALVMSKSFLLESERSMYDVIKSEGTDEDMQRYTLLSHLKAKIKGWSNNYQAHADSIMGASQRMAQIERQLVSSCHGYSNGTGFLDVDYASVKQALKPGEVLVDFADFVSHTQGRRYAAYIVDKAQQYPLLVSLFAERQVDSLGITRPDMYYDADYAGDVLRLLWNPLKEYIAEGATIYYVPSQLLFRMALESLPLPDGTLLGDHYHFVRLSSARQLVKMRGQSPKASMRTAVLYGGLQYDLEPMAMQREARNYDLKDVLALRGGVVRGDSVFHFLKGTGEEVSQIASILKKNHWQVTLYTGAKGTEESFLSMHGRSPQVLQVATHGFYYTPTGAEEVSYLKGYTDAMQLSGLVLSGGNAAWLGRLLPEGVLGGILTANNIARLNLSATDLVVLSACRSGQGEATSEGLYGLQRAFKKAGVGTIVMALWDVSDGVAPEFMAAFYERLAAQGDTWNKRQAFDEAKALIRERHPNPFYWAAFVMLD